MLQAGRKYTEEEIEILAGLFSNHLETGFFQMELDESIYVPTNNHEKAWVEYLADNLKVSHTNKAFAKQYGGEIKETLIRKKNLTWIDVFTDTEICYIATNEDK